VNSSATALDSDLNNNIPKYVRSKTNTENGTPCAVKKSQNSVSEMLKDGSLKKMPVTNTITGTVYYRKSSKGGSVIEKKEEEEKSDEEEQEAEEEKRNPSRYVMHKLIILFCALSCKELKDASHKHDC
jgi:hypothetical protein